MCDTLEALFPKLQYTIQKFGVGEILYMFKKKWFKVSYVYPGCIYKIQ